MFSKSHGVNKAAMLAALSLIIFGAGCGNKKEETPLVQSTITPPASDTTQLQTVPPPQQEPKPAVVEAEDGVYTVQVSSWRSMAKADQEAQKFQSEGFPAYVQQAYIPSKGGTWYRVRIGRFSSPEQAESLAQTLGDMLESDYWITRRPQGGNSD